MRWQPPPEIVDMQCRQYCGCGKAMEQREGISITREIRSGSRVTRMSGVLLGVMVPRHSSHLPKFVTGGA